MRVIAGKYKSIKLNALEGLNTRPTTDKVKENLFNMIDCDYAKVLDLFGGSGGLGIESLSRGAEHVTFIDGSSSAVRVIRSNVEKCKIEKDNYNIYRNDFMRALKILGSKEEKFDIIFLDPPYDKGLINQSLEKILEYKVCNKRCLIVCEKSKTETVDIDLQNLKLIKDKQYGITDILIFEYGEEE